MKNFIFGKSFGSAVLFLMFLGCFAFVRAQQTTRGVIIGALEDEQKRAFDILRKRENPPYFLSYLVTDTRAVSITASRGALRNSDAIHLRNLDTMMRVGDMKLDNTRNGGISTFARRLPIENDADAIKSVIWDATDDAYKSSVDTLARLKTERETTVEDEYPADDFSPVKVSVASNSEVSLKVNQAEWETIARRLSAIFTKYPEIYQSVVSFTADATNRYYVSSEGASVQHGKTLVRILISASTKAPDGMDLFKYETFDAVTPDGLPNEAAMTAAAEKVAGELLALRKSPVTEPFDGPAILSGRASGVFFHEIFGHRIEGHRQKGNNEGNTFTTRVNQAILPSFISVTDDPTIARFGTKDLNGFYLFDEEGAAAQKVSLVDKGILRNFLMSRSPIKDFAQTNGHGRAAPGLAPVSRQGNLIVQSAQSVSSAKLRQMLIDEAKRQGKAFGLYFEDISGGFTTTSRSSTQAFQVTPIVVWRVYTDGRPDELVRGVDLIGTPLTSFSKIIATDDKPEIFNGFCGAESGFIPVSAISPAILISQIEIQKRAKSNDIQPILPPPAAGTK